MSFQAFVDAVYKERSLPLCNIAGLSYEGYEETPLSSDNEDCSLLTNLAMLSLTGMWSRELPFQLSQSTSLVNIKLSVQFPVSKRINKWPNNVENFTSLTRLTILHVDPRSTEESPIFNWPNMQILVLRGVGFTNFPNMQLLTALQKLTLSGNHFTDLPEIKFLSEALRHVDLSANQLSTLSELTTVTSLKINDNQFTHIPPWLVNSTRLEALYIKSNPLEPAEFSKLEVLTNLHTLGITLPEWGEGHRLLLPSQIVKLDLSGSYLQEEMPNLYLIALEVLNLARCSITAISEGFFEGTLLLRELDLSHNSLLKDLPRNILRLPLQKLNTVETGITSLEPLQGSTNLQELKVTLGCEIKLALFPSLISLMAGKVVFTGIENCQNLIKLTIKHQPELNLGWVLEHFSNLRYLEIFGGKITLPSNLILSTSLKTIKVFLEIKSQETLKKQVENRNRKRSATLLGILNRQLTGNALKKVD